MINKKCISRCRDDIFIFLIDMAIHIGIEKFISSGIYNIYKYSR